MSKIRLLIKKMIPRKIFDKLSPYGHLLESIFYQTLNGFPAKNLIVIGVTGTDGKTSTSTILSHILRSGGAKTAMLGTIDFDLGQGPESNKSRLTTVGAKNLAQLLKKIKANSCQYLVLETTSHALAEHRTWGVPYSVAVMTNVGHEHLDYHKTFKNYRNAKLKLFKLTNRNLRGLRAGIINNQDPSRDLFASNIKNKLSYGFKGGDLNPKNLKMMPSGSTYKLQFNFKGIERKINVKLNLPGDFNVANSLAAIGACLFLGLSDKQIEYGISSLQKVEGRMHKINEGQDFDLVIDYAHTPDSFKKIFKTFRPITKGSIITVFGSAGRRDETKRYTQGEIAGKYSDIIIATEEDDRDQDGMKILEQIAGGAQKSGKIKGKNLYLIHEREKAIQKAVSIAKKGDLILLLGKGHEQSILTNKPGLKLKPGEVFDEEAHTLKLKYSEETVARTALKTKLKK